MFGLWMPGRVGGEGPERYLPTGAGTDYQYAGPGYWPVWGGSSNGFNIDLKLGSRLYGMGYNGPPGSKCLVLSGPHLRRLAQRDLRRPGQLGRHAARGLAACVHQLRRARRVRLQHAGVRLRGGLRAVEPGDVCSEGEL